MSSTTSDAPSASENSVTVAKSTDGCRLNKTIYFDSEEPYDKAKYFVFRSIPIAVLSDLYVVTKQFLKKEYCCFLRGLPVDDTITTPQRRLLYDDVKTGEKASIIERACNWYVLDIDGIGTVTGNLKEDTKDVLLALGLRHVECFAVASSGYMRKPDIRIKLFLWNDEPVNSSTLKKYYASYSFVDQQQFTAVQPIFIARPSFKDGLVDPVQQSIVWLPGRSQTTHVIETSKYSDIDSRPEDRYIKKEAIRIKNKFFRVLEDVPPTKRHPALIDTATVMGKLCAQGHFDEDELKEELAAHVWDYWRGNRDKDIEAIEYGFKRGLTAWENSHGSF
jgi:hypothetical protein